MRVGESLRECLCRLRAEDEETLLVLLTEDGDDIETALKRKAEAEAEEGRWKRAVMVLGDDLGLSNEWKEMLDREHPRALRVSVGALQQLSSHCIVLIHHYLDRLLGPSCTAKPWPRDGEESRRDGEECRACGGVLWDGAEAVPSERAIVGRAV